jgi:hypothetical protein
LKTRFLHSQNSDEIQGNVEAEAGHCSGFGFSDGCADLHLLRKDADPIVLTSQATILSTHVTQAIASLIQQYNGLNRRELSQGDVEGTDDAGIISNSGGNYLTAELESCHARGNGEGEVATTGRSAP